MVISYSILPILFAGIMNASFVIPIKYINNASSEKVWLFHSVIGLAIIPWLILACLLPVAFDYYPLLQMSALLFLVIGGLIFGIGQVCFAQAIPKLGIALSFAISLGIGVTIGSMFVVFYQHEFFTVAGGLLTLAVGLIIAGLILSYYASRNHQNHIQSLSSNHGRGWVLAILAGISSGFQNITFVLIAFHTKTQFQASDSFWVWPPFLLAAAIPMTLGFRYFMRQNSMPQLNMRERAFGIRNICLLVIMGLLFTGSLALYSRGMSVLPPAQQIIGWPTLMVSIILVSQGWGWLYGEYKNTRQKSQIYRLCSIALLVIAIILLSMKG